MLRLLACLVLAALASALPLHAADIASAEDCQREIAVDPAAAREAAAAWTRRGGGVPARLCEGAALEALGATASAARLLTALAENPNRAMSPELRLVTLTDGARLWLEAGAPEAAAAALAAADSLGPATPERELLRARVAAAGADWPAALAALDRALAAAPDDGEAHALRAAALRLSGDPGAAVAEADRARALAPDRAGPLFEAAAARAELGERQAAAALWLELLQRFPDSSLAGAARRNLQAMQ